MAVNTPTALASGVYSDGDSAPRRHTVTLAADTLSGKLLPLENSFSALEDQGNYQRNAQGVAKAQTQSTYYANQTLISVSVAGTSFSFVRLMLEAYFPMPSEAADISASPEPSESLEIGETDALEYCV